MRSIRSGRPLNVRATAHLARGSLAEVRVGGWDVQNELFIGCNADRLTEGRFAGFVWCSSSLL